jgi:hypothetical protein
MPSQLTKSLLQQLSGSVGIKQKAVSSAEKSIETIPIHGPFSGFVPDIDANLIDGTSFNLMENVLARSHGQNHGEVLGLPEGYRQLDSARLPLGDVGGSLPASPLTDATPVVRLDQFTRFAPTAHANPGEFTGEFIPTSMAVTSGDGTTANTGSMYRINASNQWTRIVGAASMTATTRQLSAGRDGRSTASPSMGDSCTAPFGATTRDANTAGNDDKMSGPINEPCWIYCNDVDEVMVFPASTVGTLAGTHVYEPLIDHITSAALDSGGANGFKCKSVETWNGRVYFLNTSEAGTRRSQRLRRTAKFTADVDPAVVGAGFYDFRDFQGEGLRVETLGDVLAVYFSDGVAFLRPTGVPTNPDEPQIIDTKRGLIGTHAVTAMGRNVHFGIFTDGWWLLDQSGRWQEVGVSNLDGKSVPKWRETFYELLPPAYRHRVQVYYDQPANLVYITLPTDDFPSPQQVWIYDPMSDRVFIENYPVTCFGSYTPILVAAVTIDALPGTIDSLAGTIESYGSVAASSKVRVHGDPSGYVYKHDRSLVGYDSAASPPVVQNPGWKFGMGFRSPTGFRNLTTIDRVSIEYFNHQNASNVSVVVQGASGEGSQTRSVVLNSGTNEDPKYRDAWFRYSSTSPGLVISGAGVFHIRNLQVDLWADPMEPRGT